MPKMNPATAALSRRLTNNHGMEITAANRLAKAASLGSTPCPGALDRAARQIVAKAKSKDFVDAVPMPAFKDEVGYPEWPTHYRSAAPKPAERYPTPRWAREVAARKGDAR